MNLVSPSGSLPYPLDEQTNSAWLEPAEDAPPHWPFFPISARISVSLCSPLCNGLIYHGIRSKGVIKGTNGEPYTAFMKDTDISQRIRALFRALHDDTSQRLL